MSVASTPADPEAELEDVRAAIRFIEGRSE